MSDEQPIDRSPEEVAANVHKLEAEAEKAEAERDKFAAEARAAVVKAAEAERAQTINLAANLHHHVWHFRGAIDPGTAAKCIDRLNYWHRTDPECDMEVIFSSPGGSITDGFALFDHLRYLSDNGHHVTTGTVGMAASMAGVLLQAGDTRWAGKEAWVLIHRAAFGEIGKTFEVEDRVKWVKRMEDRIVDIFVNRADGKITSQRIRRNWNRKDWWLNSDECLELGVVDELRG